MVLSMICSWSCLLCWITSEMTLSTSNEELFSNYKHTLTNSFIKQQDLQAVNGKKLQFSVNKNALYFGLLKRTVIEVMTTVSASNGKLTRRPLNVWWSAHTDGDYRAAGHPAVVLLVLARALMMFPSWATLSSLLQVTASSFCSIFT